jgi:Flp pilus assembly protein TadG
MTCFSNGIFSVAARSCGEQAKLPEKSMLGKLVGGYMRAFLADRRGNIAMIFALSLVPLMMAVGVGLDYARAVTVRTSMSRALDAAALAVGASPTMTTTQMQTLAQQYFSANYKLDASYGTPVALTVTPGTQSITIAVSSQMPTSLLKVVGIRNMTVDASTKVVWGQLKLWVALVLDNTGSMSQTDYTYTSKMSALKTASHQLLTMLQGASTVAGDVQVSIIPFTRDVNIGTSYNTSSWLSLSEAASDFKAAPPTPAQSVGPGSNCPWSDGVIGHHCQANPTNGSSTVNTIPSSGTYKGYICPSVTTDGHYWNGCFNSVSAGGSKYNHTWIPNATSTWTGCVTDRGTATGPVSQNYDVNNLTPTPSTPSSMMVAENSPSCPSTTVLSLGYNWTTLNNKIDAMQANGSTNQTIGLAWGWHSLSQGAPLNPPALPANTQRVIILLSDGLNTQDRWYGDGSNQSTQVDARMALACSNAKADGITIYAVFVDLNGTQGNSAVLQNCASDSGKYFDLTTSGQIVSAFNAIGQQITNLRVSQ